MLTCSFRFICSLIFFAQFRVLSPFAESAFYPNLRNLRFYPNLRNLCFILICRIRFQNPLPPFRSTFRFRILSQPHTKMLIDHIYINKSIHHQVKCGIAVFDISDHLPIFSIINVHCRTVDKKWFYCNYKSFNKDIYIYIYL